MSSKNKKSEVRLGSTFASYEPKTPQQQKALDLAKFIADGLIQGNGAFNTHLAELNSPFSDGYLYCFSGQPGRGKTHLIEAIINEIKGRAPNVYDAITFQRGNLPYSFSGSIAEHDVDWKPIVFFDDVWADKNSIDELNERDVIDLARFIQFTYDRKLFVAMSTNFPFVEQVLPMIRTWDKVGRIYSRAEEMILSRSQGIEIEGPDHRHEMAMARSASRIGFFNNKPK